MKHIMEMYTWLDTATSGIRFGPDREAARKELEGHIEDKTACLLRAFPDMTQGEAQEQALSSMGDPQQLKWALARAHCSWLGYLWMFSRWALVLLAAALVISLILFGSRYAALEDGPQYGFSWNGHVPPQGLEPDCLRLGGYTFRIAEAVYEDWPQGDAVHTDRLRVSLQVSSPRFWERVKESAIQNGVTLVTQDGKRCPMDRAEVSMDQGDWYYRSGIVQDRQGVFYREFTLYAESFWQEGDRVSLELNFELGGGTLSARPVREEMGP